MTKALEKQIEHLKKATCWAGKIREKLTPLLESHGDRVHFRPSSRGIAMIGLLHDRPQRGSKVIRNLDSITKNFEAMFTRYCNPSGHGRKTGEKELQSFLIREANKHKRLLEPLNAASRAGKDPVELVFISDELAMPLEKGKLVCDILALRFDDKGRAIPVLIELKDKRSMRRLAEQVENYAAVIDAHAERFALFYSDMLGKPILFGAKTEKWIVWPSLASGGESREAELAEKGIRVVGYKQKGKEFSFCVGPAPVRAEK